jgi:sporulation protein YlmC with PRC-barrel domain
VTHADQITLVSLRDSNLALADPADDLRGMTVVDPHQHRVGTVEDLVVDDDERRVRMLVVVSGGILGLGVSTRLVPVDAVIKVDDRVHLAVSHTQVHDATYDDAVDATRGYRDICATYGYPPFWASGDVHPYFLGRPQGS